MLVSLKPRSLVILCIAWQHVRATLFARHDLTTGVFAVARGARNFEREVRSKGDHQAEVELLDLVKGRDSGDNVMDQGPDLYIETLHAP